MKRTGSVVAASVAVASSASAIAAAVSCSDPMPDYVSDPKSPSQREGGRKGDVVDGEQTRGCDPTERFAPRFDGLRFIETLVTAHR